MSSEETIVRYPGLPIFEARFNWTVGELMERFIKELANRKILGTKCPKCGYRHVPPRNRCVKCRAQMGFDNLTELSGKGNLLSYTVDYVDLDGAGNFVDLSKPRPIGMIKLGDADSPIFMPLGEIDPKDLREGLEVEVAWREETKGELADIKYFKPSKM